MDRWLRDAGKPQRFRLDDSVDYTLNGRFGAGFADLRVGDRVTIRYAFRLDGRDPVCPEFVRISRPGG